jgi:MFS family permease
MQSWTASQPTSICVCHILHPKNPETNRRVFAAGDQYLNGLTLFFVGYVLFEFPCNIILRRATPRIWLPTLSIIWGVVATLLGVVQNYSGFLSSRFFLGVAESGLFPGVVFYMSMWYKRNEQHYRIALFFSAASLAGAFGGILAWVGVLFTVGLISN